MDANDKHCVYVTQKERKSWNMYNDFNVRNSRKQEHFQNQNIKCNAYFNVLKERREQLWEKLKGIYPAQSCPGMAQSLRVHFLELTRQWWGGKKTFYLAALLLSCSQWTYLDRVQLFGWHESKWVLGSILSSGQGHKALMIFISILLLTWLQMVLIPSPPVFPLIASTADMPALWGLQQSPTVRAPNI